MDLRIHPALDDADLRVLSPGASSRCHSASVRLWGKRSRCHNISSKQQQSRPNMFAVTVVVLGRSLYFSPISQPPPP